MNKFLKACYGLTLASLCSMAPVSAVNNFPDTDADAQSPARPFDFAPVNDNNRWEATTDWRALDVQNYFDVYFDGGNFTSGRLDFEQLLLDGATQITTGVDPYLLTFDTESLVRVYFIDELASHRNSLGFVDVTNLDPADHPLDDKGDGSEILIFPNTNYLDGAALGREKGSGAVQPMDYVDIGEFAADSLIEFFMIDEGGSGLFDGKDVGDAGTEIWFSDQSHDIPDDDFFHFLFYSLPGREEILVRMEDLVNGGPSPEPNYTDLYFLIQVVPTPEPSTYLLLGSFLLMGMVLKRRQEAREKA